MGAVGYRPNRVGMLLLEDNRLDSCGRWLNHYEARCLILPGHWT